MIMEGGTDRRLDAAAAEPLGVDLVLRVILAVVVVPVLAPDVVAGVREPHAHDRVAGLQHSRAPVLGRCRRKPRLHSP
jgi:hypothetical protein